jgi:peptide/nickel transport system ATP-binding protein
LEIRGLTVRYAGRGRGLTAVAGVDLDVPAGEVVGLVGESGSGKSTIARALMGLAPVSGGSIRLDGTDLDPGPRRRGGSQATAGRSIQMVFQDPYASLDPRMTVGETIGEVVTATGRVTRRERTAEVARLLELVALDASHAARLPRELSGGQRQRVAIARALAADPDVLVADEITSALDVSVQGAILNLVRDLQQRLGLTVLFISHNLSVVRYVSDTVAVMYLGRIVEVGPVDDVIADPQHPYTRTLLDAVPHLGATARPAPAGADGDLPDPHEPPPGCRFHTRCPVGPLVDPGRTVCVSDDPGENAPQRRHRSACHFAPTVPVAAPTAKGRPPATGTSATWRREVEGFEPLSERRGSRRPG